MAGLFDCKASTGNDVDVSDESAESLGSIGDATVPVWSFRIQNPSIRIGAFAAWAAAVEPL
jgi:hypothetical protein